MQLAFTLPYAMTDTRIFHTSVERWDDKFPTDPEEEEDSTGVFYAPYQLCLPLGGFVPDPVRARSSLSALAPPNSAQAIAA